MLGGTSVCLSVCARLCTCACLWCLLPLLIWQAILAEQHTRGGADSQLPRVMCAPPSHRARAHRAHGDMFVARSVALLTDIINNRLYERLRERGGLVYSVDMAFDPLFYADAGFFTLALAPFPDKIDVAVDLGELPGAHAIFACRSAAAASLSAWRTRPGARTRLLRRGLITYTPISIGM